MGRPLSDLWLQASTNLPELTAKYVPQIKHVSLGLLGKLAGVGMGFLEDDPARLTEQRAQERWLKDMGADIEMKRATWAALRAEEGSEGLFNLLAGLGSTADAKNVRVDMSQRVWWVLEALKPMQACVQKSLTVPLRHSIVMMLQLQASATLRC